MLVTVYERGEVHLLDGHEFLLCKGRELKFYCYMQYRSRLVIRIGNIMSYCFKLHQINVLEDVSLVWHDYSAVHVVDLPRCCLLCPIYVVIYTRQR